METPVNLRGYLTGGSIFTAIQTIKKFPFFVGNDSDELDYMLTLNYGQRLVFSAFIDVPVNTVAKHIVKLYGDKWDGLIKFNENSVNIGAASSVKTTGKQKTTGVKTDNTDVTNKVSAFNSDELLVDTGTTTVGDENTTQDVNRDSLVETFNIQTAFNNLPLAEKTNIINVVLKDVANYLTVLAY
jgi:hypothetical protein